MRALVPTQDHRAEHLRQPGADVAAGDLREIADVEPGAGNNRAVGTTAAHELLMMIIRGEQVPAVLPGICEDGYAADPLGERAAVVFAADLAADRLPSVRAIRAALHVGQPRAQRLRGYLAAAGSRRRADRLGPHGPSTGAVAP